MKSNLFIHHPIETIEQVNSPNGRRYVTPTGSSYPSVTTVLSIESAEYITEWRNKVGHKVADEISRKAAARGTMIHSAAEQYIEGIEYNWGMFDANNREMFNHLLPVLESLQEIHAMETRLYSDKLKCAGTVDLIAKIDGSLTILDWKTSGRVKTRDDIHGYFKQCAFYAHAFFERTGILVPNITIAMTVDDYGLLIFKEKVRDWLPEFITIRQKFRELHGY